MLESATPVKASNLIVEVDPPAAVITINRESVHNALDSATLAELRQVVEELNANPQVRGIIITGAGTRAFVSGADISELSTLPQRDSVQKARQGQDLYRYLESLDKPVIAAINGHALGGGCELALACDIRLAAENAKLGLPEVSLGIIPGYGGTQRLPRTIGKGQALEMILTGHHVNATEALRLGLVNRVVPAAELLQAARTLVRHIAKNAPLAVAAAKRAVHQGLSTDLDRGLEIEALQFGFLCATQDRSEGLNAFLERRRPRFEGQ